ncbi:MAG: preprotein translocase subunit SecE [Acidimicrobiales bacterium]
MNRETKRMMRRQGHIEADGSPALRRDRQPPPTTRRRRRTSPAQFVGEIRDELRQVAWPTRPELINYTAVVVITLVIMVSLIFVLNLGFGKAVLYMFQK